MSATTPLGATPLGVTTDTLAPAWPAGLTPRDDSSSRPSPFFDERAGLWRVHSNAQVKQAFLDITTFTPENALLAHTPLSPAALRILTRVGFALPPTLANNGGPTHTPMRAALMTFFSPHRVRATAALASRLIDSRCAALRSASAQSVDLVPHLAWDIPARVMFDIIGVHHSEHEVGAPAVPMATFKRWSQDSLELFWGWPDSQRQLELAEQAAEFYAWLRQQVRHARETRDGSLFDALAQLTFTTRGGETLRGPMTEREICAVGYFLFIAGQETTCQLITTLLHYALNSPRWAEFTDPKLATDLVLEVLRTDTPVHTWRRRVSRPVQLGDVTLQPGDEVLLDLAGSGRDASAWPEASTLQAGRPGLRGHQAFGTGIHRCVGAPLAEMEAVLTVQALARVFPAARLDDPAPEWLNLLSFRAPLTARTLLG
ncbi:cytochrome P450 [Micrococcales bacterium 31B]|nr:cytochrome P450 [Micrococcales bacterium 31B]